MKFAVSKELIEMGIDEDIIRDIHSKTKLKHREIEEAELIRSCDNKLLIRLKLNSFPGVPSRQMVLNINKNKIRDIKLEKIFNL